MEQGLPVQKKHALPAIWKLLHEKGAHASPDNASKGVGIERQRAMNHEELASGCGDSEDFPLLRLFELTPLEHALWPHKGWLVPFRLRHVGPRCAVAGETCPHRPWVIREVLDIPASLQRPPPSFATFVCVCLAERHALRAALAGKSFFSTFGFGA